MGTNLKNNLVATVLQSYITKFQYFFNDIEFSNFADQNFMRRLLTSLDCQVYPPETTVIQSGKQFEFVYFVYSNKVNILDDKELFVLATLSEGSWFGDFNAFVEVHSAFTYVANYEPDSQKEEDLQRVMLFMCPIDKFRAMCKDYPHAQKWMAQRSLMRRNYFLKVQRTLYARHNVDAMYDHPRYRGKKLDEGDAEMLRERVYKTVTRESAKINFDPHSTSTRQELLKTEACALKSDRETKNFGGEALDYAQTQVSCLRASIAVGMARKQIEETAKKKRFGNSEADGFTPSLYSNRFHQR